jgi:hypothetical protein
MTGSQKGGRADEAVAPHDSHFNASFFLYGYHDGKYAILQKLDGKPQPVEQ